MFVWLRSDTYVGLKSLRVRVPACKKEINDTLLVYSALLSEWIFASMNYKLAVNSIFTYTFSVRFVCRVSVNVIVIHTPSARHAFTSMLLLTIPKYKQKNANKSPHRGNVWIFALHTF